MFGRRDFLSLALATAPATFWTAKARAFAATGDYRPVFFSDAEWRCVQSIVDRLIPANEDGPGGLEAGAPVFIDRQLAGPYGEGAFFYMKGPFAPHAPSTLGDQSGLSPRTLYQKGVAALDGWCQQNKGKVFCDLDANARDEVLLGLEKGRIQLKDINGVELFQLIHENTKEGYFSDPLYGGNKDMGAWKMIGFPGARADFTDWMDKPGAYYPYGPVSIEARIGRSGQGDKG